MISTVQHELARRNNQSLVNKDKAEPFKQIEEYNISITMLKEMWEDTSKERIGNLKKNQVKYKMQKIYS